MFKKITTILPGIVLFYIIAASNVFATLEFNTRNNITYQIGARGDAKVNQRITLTNNFSNIYPKEYVLKIENNRIENISANDSQGNILKKTIRKPEYSEIQLQFNDKAVGKGKSITFEINYTLSQFAIKRGQVWEIIIPGLENKDDIEEINLVVKVPTSFGGLSYSSKKPKNTEIIANTRTISFAKDQIDKKSLILAFGEFQIFDFNLKFSINNPQSEPVVYQIPVPPDTAYQSINLINIDPQPEKISLDQDLNWLAEYRLKPQEAKTIIVSGQAKILPGPKNTAFINASGLIEKNVYLNSDQYWETENPRIINTANSLRSAKEIYQFVVKTLEYDFENVKTAKRSGALSALKTKKGVCTEFSDLFVALSRAAGIPAREIQGFAFTNNQKIISLSADNDVLHSWAEFWDQTQNIWQPVDPTWAKTTGIENFSTGLDLGHFAFVIHGASSTKPAPPGFYKVSGDQKNINVAFAEELIPQENFEFNLEIKSKANKELALLVKNKSLAPAYLLEIEMSDWKGKNAKKEIINILPPLGEKEFPLEKPNLLSRLFGKPKMVVNFNNQTFELKYPKQKLNFSSIFANLIPE